MLFSLPTSFSQVSRFLVVNPQGRLTAEEALAHPFFQQYDVEEVRHFSPRGKFKVLKLPSHPGPWSPSPPGTTTHTTYRLGFPGHLSSPSHPPVMVPRTLAPGKTDVL